MSGRKVNPASQLRDRVSFFEQLSGKRSPEEPPGETPGEAAWTSRSGDSSFEESYERLVEEGDYEGAKLLKFERITVKKSVREVAAVDLRCASLVDG
jgi:hypothetical protein